jgi:TP901 family phage tail tape measure protein
MSGSVFKLALEFSLIDAASHGLHAIRDRILSIADANEQVKRSYDKMVTAGKYAAMTAVSTKEFAEKLEVAVDLAAEMQQTVAYVRADMGGLARNTKLSEEALDGFTRKAFQTEAWTPFGEEELIRVQGQLKKLGVSLEDINKKGGAGEATASLARVLDMPLQTAGENLPLIAKNFKVAGDGYMGLADDIQRAASLIPESAREGFLQGLIKAAPVATEVKRPKEEIIALTAELARMGIVGPQAGIGIRKFLLGASKIKDFKDAHGQLKSTGEIIDTLNRKLAGKGEADKMMILAKAFDPRSINVILGLMDSREAGEKGIAEGMKDQLSIQEKAVQKNRNFIDQYKEMKNQAKSVADALFQPALAPLQYLVNGTKGLLQMADELVEKHKSIGEVVSKGSLGLVAGGAVASAGLGLGAFYYGRKVLKGVGGWKGLLGKGSLAAGVAEGKALEKVAGVTPVFVTNWPAGVGNIAGPYSPWMPPKPGPLASGGIVEGIKKTPGFFKGLISKFTGPIAAAGFGTTALAVAGAGAAGYGTGRLAGENVSWSGKSLDEHVQDLFARMFLSKKEQDAYFAPTINVSVDKDGRAVVEYEGQGKAKAKINVKREKF